MLRGNWGRAERFWGYAWTTRHLSLYLSDIPQAFQCHTTWCFFGNLMLVSEAANPHSSFDCTWFRWPPVTSSHPSNYWPSLATSWLGKHPQATGKSFHSSCKHSWTLTSLISPCVTLDNPGSSKNLETAATEVVVVRAEVGLKKQKCRISNKN